MNDDKTAVSIPWPGDEEGIVDDAGIPHPWDAAVEPQTVNGKAYVSNRRIVGLEMEGATLHAYGVSSAGVTVRTLADGTSARFVSGAWLTVNRDPASTLLGAAISMLKGLQAPWTDIDLAIDDRPILGEGSTELAQATVDRANWRCAVTGAMTLPGWSDLSLRPSIVDRRGDGAATVLEFLEDGAAAGDLPDIVIALTALAAGGAASYTLDVADLPVLPLLDKLADGAWERPAHLWIGAREGWLYLPHPAPGAMLPYAVGTETRLCDIARCIGPSLAGMGGKLLLDSSGAKTLTARIEGNHIVSLSLRISQPAIAFQLAHAAVDGTSQPPDPSRLDTLHLVPRTLSGDADSTWKFSMKNAEEARLAGAWTPVPSADLPVFHTRSEDWVLPPEAAANAGKHVSPLRTLVPLLSSTGTVTCTFGPGGIVSVTQFDTISDAATVHGPLARFSYWPAGVDNDNLLCTERWPDPDAGFALKTLKDQAAVLRPLYRLLPAELADTLGGATFGATLTGRPLTEPPQAVQPAPGGGGYAWRAGTATTFKPAALARRTETRAAWPDPHFGWDEGSIFRSHRNVFATATPAPAAVWDWLEHRPPTAGGTDFTSLLWVRLSDGSLVDKAFARTGSVQEALERLRTVDPAVAPAVDSGVAAALGPVDLLRVDFEDAGGLPLLALYETVGVEKSDFSLVLRAAGTALTGPGATVMASASRIVAAWAGRQAAVHALDRGIVTSHLTRVFLELERESGAARVVRALLGWEVEKAFGLKAEIMHVTEIFDTEALETRRKLEFNGVLRVAALGPRCKLSIYCWDAVLRRNAETLPVVCNYELTHPTIPANTAAICALQDARVAGDRLDLAADIAFFGTEKAGVEGTATHPWEPDRRGLFRFTVSLQPGIYNLKGFVKVRMRSTQANATLVPNVTTMRLIPAWALCDREIVPRFTSGRSAERADAAWCQQGLLRSAQSGPGGTSLDVQVFHDVDLWNSFNYGCTLVGEALPGGAVADGLPVWVPSPLRMPTGVTQAPASRPSYRLWIFNPHAYVIDSWPADPLPAEDPANTGQQERVLAEQTSSAIHQARTRLWHTGWTREAVLERQPAPPETDALPTWTVIDSPLQNRGASIAWMGWPMAGGDRHPVDELPLSAQIPQRDPSEADSFSVQVAFEADQHDAGGAPLWPVLYRSNDAPGPPPAPAAPPEALGMLGFSSRGLRVGVPHRLVHYGADIRTLATQPLRLQRRTGAPATATLSDQGVRSVHWAQQEIPQGDVKVAHDNGVLTLTLPLPRVPAEQIASVRIAGLPPTAVLAEGTIALTPATPVPVVPGAPANGGTISLLLPPGPLPHFTVEHLVDGTWVALEVFPGFKPRLAGIFDADRRLLAFGEEALAYQPDPGGQWLRSSSASLQLPSGSAIGAVMTIDIDGIVTVHETAS
jgi:hypothetical protein